MKRPFISEDGKMPSFIHVSTPEETQNSVNPVEHYALCCAPDRCIWVKKRSSLWGWISSLREWVREQTVIKPSANGHGHVDGWIMHEAAGLSLLPCGHAVVTCEACNPGGLSLAAALSKPQMGEATTWHSLLYAVFQMRKLIYVNTQTESDCRNK